MALATWVSFSFQVDAKTSYTDEDNSGGRAVSRRTLGTSGILARQCAGSIAAIQQRCRSSKALQFPPQRQLYFWLSIRVGAPEHTGAEVRTFFTPHL